MKIKDIALSAAVIGERVVKAIAIGAVEVWSAIKYIIFKDKVVEQICATNFGDGVGITEEQAAAVTDIGKVFQGNTEITSFDELEKFTNVKTLNNTFNGCTNLQSVKVENIEIIQGNAFRNTALEGSLHFKELKRIAGSGSNFLNTSITSIVFDKLEYFYSNLFDPQFKGCNKLTNVVFPTTLLNLGTPDNTNDGAAFNDTPLSNVNLEHFQYIGPHFRGCKNLRIHLNLPEVTKLKQSFSNSVVLSVYAPKLKTLAGACFQNCAEMRGDISFPLLEGGLNKNAFGGSGIDRILDLGKITTIESVLYGEALGRMPNVTFIHLPETITEIGERAMADNRNLKEVIIDAITPPSIGTNVFASSHADLSIYVPDQSVQAYREASGWLSYADKILPMEAYLYGYIKFADPAVEAICLANWDTNGSGYLNKEEAKAVTSIGTVFQGNKEITSFDEFEEFIGVTKQTTRSSFSGCTNLKSIKLPKGLQQLGQETFFKCTSLVGLVLPSTLKFIGWDSLRGCSAMSHLVIMSETKVTIEGASTLFDTSMLIYVPDAIVDDYKTSSGWSNYADRIRPLSTFVEPTNE